VNRTAWAALRNARSPGVVGHALTLSTVDFESFCESRPELPGAALDDFEQAA
jgi:hypothetical protein